MTFDKARFQELLENASNAFAMEKYDTAIALVREALEMAPEDARALSLGATILANMDKLDEAETLARRAVESAPRNADIRGTLGSILREQGKYDEAVEALRKSLDLIRKDTEFCRVFVSTDLALALAEQGEFSEASRVLDDAGTEDEDGVIEVTRQKLDRMRAEARASSSRPN